jgi:hypothetical protein
MEIAIITLLVLVTTGFGLYRWQRNPSGEPRESLPPRDFGGLFPGGAAPPGQQPQDNTAADNTNRKAAEFHKQLLTRANDGDLTCLTDAHAAGGGALYDEVLDSLTAWASGRQERLQDIVSYIVNHPELRANKTVADSVLVSWAANPAAYPAADVMHFAALANDAQAYLTAVQAAMRLWSEGTLPRLSAAQLHQLVESQYWIMSGEARASGAGFLLKQQMARLRDELARPRSDGPR